MAPTSTSTSTTNLVTATSTSPSTEESTTDFTLPPGCISGNLNERVCRVEDMTEELQQNFEEYSYVFREDLKNQSLIISDILDDNKEMRLKLEEMENVINELVNHPCACK